MTSWLLTLMPWRAATATIRVGRLAAAVAILAVRGLPGRVANMREAGRKPRVAPWAPIGRGFSLLLAIAMTDSTARMGFLTFLPFLLKIKGADLPTRIALTLIFAGGAASNLASGWLGARLRVVRATFITEGLTAVGDLGVAAAASDRGSGGLAGDRDGAQRHLVGALRHGSRAGGAVTPAARLHRRGRCRRACAGAVWPRQRPRRRPDDDDAGRCHRARDHAACLATRAMSADSCRSRHLT
jgi:hypothetical protein